MTLFNFFLIIVEIFIIINLFTFIFFSDTAFFVENFSNTAIVWLRKIYNFFYIYFKTSEIILIIDTKNSCIRVSVYYKQFKIDQIKIKLNKKHVTINVHNWSSCF